MNLSNQSGQLTVGACADLTVLNWRIDAAPLADVDGVVRPGDCWEPRAGGIVAGENAANDSRALHA